MLLEKNRGCEPSHRRKRTERDSRITSLDHALEGHRDGRRVRAGLGRTALKDGDRANAGSGCVVEDRLHIRCRIHPWGDIDIEHAVEFGARVVWWADRT